MNTKMTLSWIGWTALAAALAAAPPVAHAQPADTTELVQQAQRLYQVGKHREAADAFASAYASTGDPALLYNLAQAARRAGDQARAASAYETYLAQVPDAPNRALIEERIATLRKSAGPPQALMNDERAADDEPTTDVREGAAPQAPAVARPLSVREGLFLRLLAGGGAHALTIGNGAGADMAGFGVGITGAIGYSLTRRWATFVELGASRAPEPEGRSHERREPYILDFGAYTFGAGVAFFPWERHNVSVSLSALATQVWYESHGDPGPEVVTSGFTGRDGLKKSSFGVGTRLVVAKEWWVRRDLSLGVGLDVVLTTNSVLPDERIAGVQQFGLALVAGYN